METYSYKSVVPGGAAKEENKDSKSNGDKESSGEDIVLQVGAGKIAKNDYRMKQASPNQMNLTCSKQLNEQLESAKSEMDEAMEENQRLKMYLDQILRDYRTLQKQYQHVVQQEAKTCPDTTPTNHDQTEESELIALSLGRSSSGTMKGGRHKLDEGNKGLKLQLDCEFQVPKMLSRVEARPNSSPENILEEVKEKKKNVKDGGDDEISLVNPAKRARVSVRIRCDTPTINDGCQWRKYGQKFTKGSPCPRAYYRCTVAPSCPVRKQVQRCAEDMSILVAMYEGTHNHPLAVSAQAMAATTSAAAAMLLSGSLTSASSSSSTTTITTANLNGLNFSLSHNSRPMPFYLPNSSISSYPTITLDLTSTSCLSSSSFSSHLSQLGCIPPRYHFNPLESSSLPNCISLSNEILSYETQPCHRSQSNNFLSFGKKPIENFSQSYPRKNSLNSNQQTLAPETIAAATKAITSSNPSFRYALVAALSSIMGSGGANNSTLENQELIKESTQNIK